MGKGRSTVAISWRMAVGACTALPTGRARALVMGEAQEKIRLAKEREARAEEEPFWRSQGGGKNAARPPVAIAAMRQEMVEGKSSGTGLRTWRN